jgi:WD40 repeat protein
VWDPGTGTELACWKGDAGPYLACAFSPDGTRIAASTTNGTVEMREATTGDVLFRTRDHGGSVFSLVFLPDGDLVSASIDTTVHLLDGRTGAVKRILEGHRNGVRCVAVSPDGERIVAGGWDATLRVWDRETGSLALVLRGHGKRIDGVAFSADGRRIVSASLDGTVRLWDALE